MISVRLNNLSLKYQKCIASCCKDIGIRKSEFVEKTQMFGNPPIKAVNFVKLVFAIILECTKKTNLQYVTINDYL